MAIITAIINFLFFIVLYSINFLLWHNILSEIFENMGLSQYFIGIYKELFIFEFLDAHHALFLYG